MNMSRKRWIIAGGAGAAAIGVLAVAMAGRPDAGASKDGASETSFLSRVFAPRAEMVAIPEGTKISVRLEQAVSTERNRSGDQIATSLDEPLMVDGKLAAPASSKVVALLTDVTDSGRVEGRASLTVVLRTLEIGDEQYDLTTQPRTFVARSTKKKDAAVIAGGAALGAAIGAIAGGGKGAAIGAGVGGGSGTGYVLATKGEPVAYGPETRMTFALTEPLELPVYKN
jgi:hypothetical protein